MQLYTYELSNVALNIRRNMYSFETAHLAYAALNIRRNL